MKTPLLSNSAMLLRALEPADIDILYQWENDSRFWDSGDTAAPLSRKQLTDYVESYDADIVSARQLRLVAQRKRTDGTAGEVVGMVDLFAFDPVNRRCGVGIIIGEEYRQRGYGIMSIELLMRYCRARLGLHQLWCMVGDSNEASRALFAKAGFSESGRLKSWFWRDDAFHDALLLQREL